MRGRTLIAVGAFALGVGAFALCVAAMAAAVRWAERYDEREAEDMTDLRWAP